MKQPLATEILHAIPGSSQRAYAGVAASMVVPIGVCGNDLMVLNKHRSLTLAVGAPTFNGQDIHWFFDVLKEDLEHPPPEGQESAPAKKK